MRVMRYRVELDEDDGYIISNVEPELCGGISHEQAYGPGIKMTILDSTPRSIKRLLKQFKFCDDNEGNPEFQECYRRVLRGDESFGWKLVAIKVYLGLLWLEFAKEASRQEVMTQGDNNNGLYYNEAVSFAPHGEEAYAELCFEVKRPDSLETETYQITISDDRTMVTELINGQKQRTIDFLPPVADATRRNYIPADESVSIENQRELLSKFAMLNGWVETKTYCDDGYSGGNFQRPGFLEMLEDARNGVINLILVKDLSRLGRDFVEVGRYTDVVFPSLGCRFVSVLDCLDSEGDNTDMLHFRSLMNDYHLRDLSSKIKSVLHSKKASGQFISAYAPYGYRKSARDKHKLVIDEYAAGIVRRIYDMRLAGTAYGQIAAALNRDGITSPRVYWSQINGKDGCKAAQLWTYATVKTILHNEVYKGTLVMNHTGTRSYKDHTQIGKPETEWIRHEALHEAIVTAEEWEAVQKINEAASLHSVGRQEPIAKLFTGKLVCADCKTPLCANAETQHRKNGTKKRYVSYFCGTYGKSGRSVCSWHRIYEQTLTQIVIAEIRTQAQAVTVNEAAVVDRLKRKIADYDEQRLADAKQEISKLRRRVQELETMTAKLYEDTYSGAVSESTFMVLTQKNEQERLAKAERLDALLSEVDKAQQKTAAIQNWTAIIRKYLNLQDLDRATIDELIDHIEVGERTVVDGQRRQDIKVFYRFVGLVE